MRLAFSTTTSSGFFDPRAALRAAAESLPCDYALLHSASGGTSVLGFDPVVTLNVDASAAAQLDGPPGLPRVAGLSPLDALQATVDAIAFEPPHPLIGWLGFLSYDLARQLERIPEHAPDRLHWPLIRFSLYRHYVIFDETGAHAFSLAGAPLPALVTPMYPTALPPARVVSQQPREAFEAKVRRIKDYIAAGDIYQANFAQHWMLETAAKPHDLFCRLCEISPAPFAACLRFTSAGMPHHVVSASPELFLQLSDRRLLTRPIKGTRPRDLADPARDAALREQLLASAKDQAELTMIVDLLRNDLGRVSDFGTVQVLDPRAIERHPTVWHTVATLESRLRTGTGLAELLAALCPGGSITGAPKIRAMQIIEELEGAGPHAFRRALYCGNIGAIGPHATSLFLNIAIRTILFQDTTAHIYAGGGIVADSDPAHEYQETLHKAAAMFRALGASLA